MRRAVARREYMDDFMLKCGQDGMRDYFRKTTKNKEKGSNQFREIKE